MKRKLSIKDEAERFSTDAAARWLERHENDRPSGHGQVTGRVILLSATLV